MFCPRSIIPAEVCWFIANFFRPQCLFRRSWVVFCALELQGCEALLVTHQMGLADRVNASVFCATPLAWLCIIIGCPFILDEFGQATMLTAL